MITAVNKTSQQGGYKVIIIAPAETMNIAASNALLKTLEEPCANTLLILISEQLAQLTATLRSRCQQLQFTAPEFIEAKQWLDKQTENSGNNELPILLAEGAPLRALEIANSETLKQRQQLLTGLISLVLKKSEPVSLASSLQKIDIIEILNWLSGWIMDAIRYCHGIALNLPDSEQFIKPYLSYSANLTNLYKMLDKIYLIKQQLIKKVNLNQQMLLESLFCNLFVNED